MNVKSICPFCGGEHVFEIPAVVTWSPAFNPSAFTARECPDCHAEWQAGITDRIQFVRGLLPTASYNEYEATYSLSDTIESDRWDAARARAESLPAQPGEVVTVDGFHFRRDEVDNSVWPGEYGLSAIAVSKWTALDERPSPETLEVDCTSREWKVQLDKALAFVNAQKSRENAAYYNWLDEQSQLESESPRSNSEPEFPAEVEIGGVTCPVVEVAPGLRVISALSHELVFEDGEILSPNPDLAKLIRADMSETVITQSAGFALVVSEPRPNTDSVKVLDEFTMLYPGIRVVSSGLSAQAFRDKFLGLVIAPITTPETARAANDQKRVYRNKWNA